ncbi:MAG: alpha/beta fold hydrolase [Pyrinomonadaceae bacterium]
MGIYKKTFENRSGKSLSALLELPVDRHPHSFAIFAHCFTCTKNLTAVRSISSALASRGFGVLSFDFTGLGESEGDFAEENFSSSVSDLICAAEFLKDNYEAPSIVIGHSLGGAAGLLAASQLDSVKAVVTIGSPSSATHVRRLFQKDIEQVIEAGQAEVSIGGRPFLIKRQFVEDLEKHSVREAIGNMRKAFLFFHSPQDRIVGIENAAELYEAASHPKSFISLDGADHLLSNKKDARYVGDTIGSWASRYIEIPGERSISTPNDVAAFLGTDERFTTQIKVGRHRLTADEPESFGGNDFGPSPYGLVASGLAACTAMTLRMYAERKNWDLREITVHVSHARSHIEDCQNCDSPNGKIDKFTRELELVGELDDDQRRRLLEIADKCPVHKTLESNARIETTLKN